MAETLFRPMCCGDPTDRILSCREFKGSSPATDTADFRISGKLIWAPPRHHRILKLVHIYHNSGWGFFFYHNAQRFFNVLKSRSQIVVSWVSVGYQLVTDPQLIPTDTKVIPN